MARLIARRLTALVAAGGMSLLGFPLGSSTPVWAADMSQQQTLINQDRANAGLPPLAWSACLAAIAVQNAQRMAAAGAISHTNGPTLDLNCGVGATQAGENVGFTSAGIDDVGLNNAFMASPGHRANILGPYAFVGTAWSVAPNGSGYIAVEFLAATAAVVPAGYHPLPPSRILDTRNGTGGVPAAQLGPGATLTVQVAGRGGVPASGVSAVVLNVTVTGTTAPGYLTVYPAEDPRPTASNLNWVAGQTVPNLMQVDLELSGQLTIFNSAGRTDVIFDVAGYVPSTTGTPGPDGLFNPLVPARILDTRTGIGGTGAPVAGGTTITFQVTGRGGVPARGVSAVVLNLTATNATARSYVTAFPAGTTRPLASNLNFGAGQTVPNRTFVMLGANGQISLFNAFGTVDLVIDVNGWFTDASNAAATGSVFTGVTPVRVLDTRNGIGGFSAPLGQGSAIAVTVAGVGGVPLTTSTSPVPPKAVVLNVTVTNGSSPSYLTAFPDGAALPLASDLNFGRAQTVPNLVVVAVGANGKVDLFNAFGTTDVVADVVGWYG